MASSPPSAVLIQLTTAGHNRQPLFIDQNTIVYVSRNRTQHKDPQLYSRNLTTGDEKRITFQRGHIANGAWLSQHNKLVFASSTDEEKETPHLLKDYLQRFPASIDTEFFFHFEIQPSEIYSTRLDGTDLNRLSFHQGFDAFPTYDSKNGLLFFSRLVAGKINIFGQKLGAKEPAKMVMDTFGHDLGLQISPQNDLLTWYRFSPDFNSSQIMMAGLGFKNQKLMTTDSGIQWTPSWHPSQETIVFSAKKGADRNYQIYEVNVADSCQRQITSLDGDEFYPVVSADGQKLIFTATASGTEQIHQMDYPSPFTCEFKY